MRENRTYGSEGGEPSNGSLPYPYQVAACTIASQMALNGKTLSARRWHSMGRELNYCIVWV